MPKGRERLAERLKDRFPAEARGVDCDLDTVERMTDEVGRALPVRGLWDAVLLPFRMPTVARYGLQSLDRFRDRFT